MQRIPSFSIDHTRLAKGLYLSREDDDVKTWDVRILEPNHGHYLTTAVSHTIEHLFATYARNCQYQNGVIYVGPMGCRTGCYFITRGLTDEEERSYGDYQTFLQNIQGAVSDSAYQAMTADPANDNYHYFRGSDFDQREASILERYKRINMPQGNSPDSDSRTESYDTSYKTTPDVEDINQDYTLNEYEKYFHYHVSVHPGDTILGQNFIVDKRIGRPNLRNGKQGYVTWYQYRIPLNKWEEKVGSISDFSSIRFMRMYLTGFEKPVVLRFGSLDLVRGEWRVYEQSLNTGSSESGDLAVSAVNIEENNEKTPVNYVLPPGIRREQDPTQPQLVESNEQALNMVVENLGNGESKAVYKNSTLDIRQYKRLEMFVHRLCCGVAREQYGQHSAGYLHSSEEDA